MINSYRYVFYIVDCIVTEKPHQGSVNKVLYCIVLYCIVLYCIVLYCKALVEYETLQFQFPKFLDHFILLRPFLLSLIQDHTTLSAYGQTEIPICVRRLSVTWNLIVFHTSGLFPWFLNTPSQAK